MLEVIYTVASKDANIDREYIWIPIKHFPDSVHFINKDIVEERKSQE